MVARAPERHDELDQRQPQRQRKREMSGLDQHDGSLPRLRARLLGLLWAFFLALPVALTPQGIGDLARHVVLVVLGEHRVGPEEAGRFEDAFGDDALPFPEQVGQQAADTGPGRLPARR